MPSAPHVRWLPIAGLAFTGVLTIGSIAARCFAADSVSSAPAPAFDSSPHGHALNVLRREEVVEPKAWDADALAPFDPNRRASRVRSAVHDPDAIAEPLFATTATGRAVNRGPRPGDPDGILTPTFGPAPRRTEGQPDDLIEPWRARQAR